jgi:hypothetical protein
VVLAVSVNSTFGHLEIEIPHATDEVTSRSDLVYEVRVANSSGASLSDLSAVLTNAGVAKEVSFDESDATKTASLAIFPTSTYAIAVTVRDQAGNRALYTPVLSASVPAWQSSLSSAGYPFNASDATYLAGSPPGARVGHQVVYLGTNYFVLGGLDHSFNFPSQFLAYRSSANDYWTSPSVVAPSGDSEYLKRAFFGAAVHTEVSTPRVFVAGGLGLNVGVHSSIMSSADGVTWSLVATSAPFLPRAGLSLISHGGAIYAIGGESNPNTSPTTHDDIYKSVDGGVSWTSVPAGARFSPRKNFSAFSMRGCLWVVGGQAVVSGTPTYYQDVWKSCDDGVSWVRTVEAATFADRGARVAAVSKGFSIPGYLESVNELMCAFGGRNGAVDDEGVYCSFDGGVWFTLRATSGIKRNDHALIFGSGGLFVFGGTDNLFSGPPTGYPTYGSQMAF